MYAGGAGVGQGSFWFWFLAALGECILTLGTSTKGRAASFLASLRAILFLIDFAVCHIRAQGWIADVEDKRHTDRLENIPYTRVADDDTCDPEYGKKYDFRFMVH